jgi:hypothetical protein
MGKIIIGNGIEQGTGYSFINNTKAISITGLVSGLGKQAFRAVEIDNGSTKKLIALPSYLASAWTLNFATGTYTLDFTGNSWFPTLQTGDILTIQCTTDSGLTLLNAIKTELDAVKVSTDQINPIQGSYIRILDSGNSFTIITDSNGIAQSVAGATLSSIYLNGTQKVLPFTFQKYDVIRVTTNENAPYTFTLNYNKISSSETFKISIPSYGQKSVYLPGNVHYINSLGIWVYVYGFLNGTSLIINLTTGELISTVPSFTTAYFNGQYSRNVSFYDVTTNKLIIVGYYGSANTIVIYDFTSRAWTNLQPGGFKFAMLTFDVNRKHVIAFQSDNNGVAISRADVQTNSLVGNFSVSLLCYDVLIVYGATLADDRYILCCGSSAYLYNPNTNTATQIASVPSAYAAVLGSNGNVYIAGSSNSYKLDSSFVYNTTLTGVNVPTTYGGKYMATMSGYIATASGVTLKLTTVSDNTIRSVTIAGTILDINYIPSINRIAVLYSGGVQFVNPITAQITTTTTVPPALQYTYGYTTVDEVGGNKLFVVCQNSHTIVTIDKSTIA